MKNKLFSSAMLVSLLAYGLILTSCGPSAAEIAIRSAPNVESVNGLKDKLIWLQGNAQSNENYVIELDADEKDIGRIELSYKDKSNITITLRGIGANRTIESYFIVGSGVTLILDDNITLHGKTTSSAIVEVSLGGTLVMNEGVTITGATNNRNDINITNVYGAGVHISDGGTFFMKGGTISGNTIQPRQPSAAEIAIAVRGNQMRKSIGGHESELGKIHCGGGGVFVSGAGKTLFSGKPTPSGTFIKTGGTITGYASNPENGNVIKDIEGNVLNGFGHAILFNGEVPKAIDTTVGPEITLNFSNGVLKEGRNEE